MTRKFRIIEQLWYDNDFEQNKIYYVQEWKKNWLGTWKWRYWMRWCYDMKENHTFESAKEAKDMIERYVKQQPHKIVVEELTF